MPKFVLHLLTENIFTVHPNEWVAASHTLIVISLADRAGTVYQYMRLLVLLSLNICKYALKLFQYIFAKTVLMRKLTKVLLYLLDLITYEMHYLSR